MGRRPSSRHGIEHGALIRAHMGNIEGHVASRFLARKGPVDSQARRAQSTVAAIYETDLELVTLAVIVYRSGLTKGTGMLSGARRIDVTMSITRIPL